MRLTIIPGVLEVNIGRPKHQMPLPRLEKQSLESLLIAIAMLRDDEGLRVRLFPKHILNEEMLRQVPEALQ